MTWILIAVIIIVLIGLGVWGYQVRNARLIQALDSQVAALDSGGVAGLIRNIQQLNLSGDSRDVFQTWAKAYQELLDGTLTELQTLLLDVEQQNKQFRFGQVKDGLANIDALQTAAAKQMNQITKALTGIKTSEAENSARIKQLQASYQEARKTVLAKSFAFGDALPALEDGLQEIAGQLTAINTLNAAGDPAKAKGELDQLKNTVAAMQLQVKTLPPLVNEVVNEFPGQLQEIQTGYDQLAAQQFHFTEDVPAGVAAITKQLAEAQTQIQQLEVTALTANTGAIANRIDSLYAVMEKELSAKTAVADKQTDVRQFINHALQQNHALAIELDHLNQSYQLNHDEIKQTNTLKVQLDDINQAYDQAVDKLTAHEAVYSEVLTLLTADHEALTAIEKQQQAINASVSGLRETEQKAVAQVNTFDRAVRDIRYEVSRHDLPGLPKPYRDFFKVVTSEIEQLKKDMNQIKIDLDAIAKQLIKVSADIDQLKKQSREVIDAAGMTEQLLQYANRYKTSHEAVATAMTAAEAAYAKYDYQGAADTIATALEAVEAGSYQKVADDYNAQQHNDLF